MKYVELNFSVATKTSDLGYFSNCKVDWNGVGGLGNTLW